MSRSKTVRLASAATRRMCRRTGASSSASSKVCPAGRSAWMLIAASPARRDRTSATTGRLSSSTEGDLLGRAGQDARVDEGAIDRRAGPQAGRGHHEQAAEGAGDRQRRQRGETQGRRRRRGVRRNPGSEIVEHLLGPIGVRRRHADVLGRRDVAPRVVELEVVVEPTNRMAGPFATRQQDVVIEPVARRHRRPGAPPVGNDLTDSLPRPEEIQSVGRA